MDDKLPSGPQQEWTETLMLLRNQLNRLAQNENLTPDHIGSLLGVIEKTMRLELEARCFDDAEEERRGSLARKGAFGDN